MWPHAAQKPSLAAVWMLLPSTCTSQKGPPLCLRRTLGAGAKRHVGPSNRGKHIWSTFCPSAQCHS